MMILLNQYETVDWPISLVESELEVILYYIIFSEENCTNDRFEEVEEVFANHYHSSIFQLH
jgi:hypothetical protein